MTFTAPSTNFFTFQKLFKWRGNLHLLCSKGPRNCQHIGGSNQDSPTPAALVGPGRKKGGKNESSFGISEARLNTYFTIFDKVMKINLESSDVESRKKS